MANSDTNAYYLGLTSNIHGLLNISSDKTILSVQLLGWGGGIKAISVAGLGTSSVPLYVIFPIGTTFGGTSYVNVRVFYR